MNCRSHFAGGAWRSVVWGLSLLVLVSVGGCGHNKKTRDQAMGRWKATRAVMKYDQAEQAFLVGDLNTTEEIVRSVIELDPKRQEAYELMARVSLERGAVEDAAKMIKLAIELDDQRAESHYLNGVILERWNRHEEALAAFRLSYQLNPDDVMGLLAVAQVMADLERLDEAIALLKSKIDYFDSSGPIRVLLGNIYMLKGEPAKASAYFQDAVLMMPDNHVVVEQLVGALYAEHKYEKTLHYLDQLIRSEVYQKRLDVHVMRADVLLRLHQFDLARVAIDQLIKLDERSVPAWLKMAELGVATNNMQLLDRASMQLKNLAPRRYEGYMYRGILFDRSGQPVFAIKSFNEATRRAPNAIVILLFKGMACERDDRPVEAMSAYEAALAIDPDHVLAKRLLNAMKADPSNQP